MTRTRRAKRIFALGAIAGLLTGMAFASSASAGWRFNGKSLEGTETIVGTAAESSLTIPGLTTTCKEVAYKMKIFNSSGIGRGEITEISFGGCSTDSAVCVVSEIGAEKLPWPLHLAAVGGSGYVVIEGVKVTILYGEEECPLFETAMTVTGSAAGLFENATSTIRFDPSTFEATKTELKALGGNVKWKGLLTTEATGVHKGEKLEV
jgi:hypothetical protein